jgi:hypothetical protein
MDTEKWIRTELIPGMVERNDFGLQLDGPKLEISDIEIGNIAPNGTFMLTKPYKVKLTLVDAARKTFKTFHLIAKVCDIWAKLLTERLSGSVPVLCGHTSIPNIITVC